MLLFSTLSAHSISLASSSDCVEAEKVDSCMFVMNSQREVFEVSLKKQTVRTAFDHRIQFTQYDAKNSTLAQLGLAIPSGSSLFSASFQGHERILSCYQPLSPLRGDYQTKIESYKLISAASLTPYAQDAVWFIFAKPEKRIYRFVNAQDGEYDRKYFGVSDKDGSVAFSNDEKSGKFVFTDSDSGVNGDQPYKEVVNVDQDPKKNDTPFNPLDFTANTATFGRNFGSNSSVYSSVIDLGVGSAAQTSRPGGNGNGSLLLTPNAISIIPLIQLPDGSYEPVLVPEPSTWLVTLGGFCATLWRRKRSH